MPAPKRGELVRLLGEELRAAKADLGRLVSIEAGKIPSEGLGEVQEMIDICDFAVGLSRQLYGLTIATERPGHRMMETWHPLGVVGVISAFNFPVAVWSWNAALALVCGDPVVWKPSEKTPLTALACAGDLRARRRRASATRPTGLLEVLIGDRAVGEVLVDHAKVPLVSATGSTRMGRDVGPRLAKRFARAILELGGNNAGIVCPSADLDLALRAIAFGAMGTAGQRCTTLRRLFVHDSVYDALVPRLKKAYESVSVGNPLETGGAGRPADRQGGLRRHAEGARGKRPSHGGKVTGGDARRRAAMTAPTTSSRRWSRCRSRSARCCDETFAPILYVMNYSDFDDALDAAQRGRRRACRRRSSPSTCGRPSASSPSTAPTAASPTSTSAPRAPRSAAPSAARRRPAAAARAGSDAWKAYMRRATNTVNYSKALPLAQGVSFDID